MKREEWFYVGIIVLLVYYIYVANQPKQLECRINKLGYQVCVLTNLLGK